MIRIGLDMASNSCGVAVLTPKQLQYDSFIIKGKELKELSKSEKIERMVNWVFENIQEHFKKDHKLIVEDTFLGKNAEAFKNVCRLQGAVEHVYFKLTGKHVHYVMAVSARANLDLLTRASKAEVQLYVIEKFNLVKIKGELAELAEYVEAQRAEYKAKAMNSSTFKSRMNKASKQIEKLTGIDEHRADSIVLCMGDKS